MINPKTIFALETTLFAPFGGNKKVNNKTDKHFELLTIVIKTKLTPLIIPKFVKNIPKNTKKAVMITVLSNNIVFIVNLNLF